MLQRAVDRVGVQVSRRELQDQVPQRRGGPRHGVAGDGESRAGEGSGVETGPVGVGLDEVDARWRGAQCSGGDLDVRGGGSLTEFHCSHGDLVDTVITQGCPGFGDVFGGRRRLVQRTGHAGSDQPVITESRIAARTTQVLVHQIDARQRAVLGEKDIVGPVIDRQQRVARPNDVAAPKFQRIQIKGDRQLVHGRLHRECRLGHAVAAQRTAGHGVGVDGVAVELLVRAAVQRDGATPGEQRLTAVVSIGTGVGDIAELDGGQDAVGAGAQSHCQLHRVPRGCGGEFLFPGEFQTHRPPGVERGQGDQILGDHLLLAPEAATDPLAEHP